MRTRYSCAAAVLLALLVAACEDDVTPPPSIDYDAITAIGYSGHVQPLLTARCATSGCHSAADTAAGLSLASWGQVIAGSRSGEALIPFRSRNSLLAILFDGTTVRNAHPTMPAGLTAPEIRFLKRWIDAGARNDAGEVPYANSARKLYVPNQGEDNVSIVDAEALVVRRIVDVGTSPMVEGPHFVVSDGSSWYVSLIGAGEVWKFDAAADTLLGKAQIGGSPALLALTPDGAKLYVSQFMTAFSDSVTIVRTSDMTVTGAVRVWTMPHGIRLNHAGTKLYVANMMSDNVSVIDVAADTVEATVMLADDVNPFGAPKYLPVEIAVSPDDALVAVSCSETREVRFIDAGSNAVVDSVEVGDQPWHLQYSPDGAYCYVTNRRGHSVSAIHVPMRHVMGSYETPLAPRYFDYPHGCDVSIGGRYTFVSNENIGQRFVPRYGMDFVGNVVVIDNVLGMIVKVLEVGRMPTGLTVAP